MSNQQFIEDLVGRGAGDPDFAGYPGEKHYIGIDKPVIEIHKTAGRFEDGDNDAADPLEADLEDIA